MEVFIINPYLTKIRLQNLQSWGDLSLDLTPGLNVLIAENQTGKSVVFKVIRLCVAPDSLTADQKADIPRIGHSTGTAWFSFSDGITYKVLITAKYRQYFVIDELGVEKFSSEEYPSADFLERMGSTIRGAIISNLLEMNESQFLINSNTSENASMLEILINDPDLVKVIQTLENKYIPAVKELIKEINIYIKTYKTSLEAKRFKPVADMEMNISYAEEIILCLQQLSGSSEFFDRVKDINSLDEDIIELFHILKDLVQVSPILWNVEKLIELPEFLKSSLYILRDLSALHPNLQSVLPLVCPNPLLKIDINVLKELSALQYFIFNVQPVQKISNSTKIMFSILKDYVDCIPTLFELPQNLFSSKTMFSILKDLVPLSNIMDEILSVGDVVTERDNLYTNIMKKGGVLYDGCPLHGKIIHTGKACIPYNK